MTRSKVEGFGGRVGLVGRPFLLHSTVMALESLALLDGK